ncbi:MAG: hypothetical protein IPL90_00190 [Holophagales bacterium]|nr:hypothetical protein [Holophagales bacterium]
MTTKREELTQDVEAEARRDGEDEAEDAEGRDLQGHPDDDDGDVGEPLEELHPERLLLRGELRHADAEEEREEDDAEHVALRGGVHGVARHDVDEERRPELGLAGRLHLRGRFAAVGLEELLSRLVREALAGPEDVDEDEPDGDGERRHAEEEAHRPRPDPSEPLQVAEARDAERERAEDERDDDHEEHPEKDLPDRHEDPPVRGLDGVGNARHEEEVCGDAADRAEEEAEEDPVREGSLGRSRGRRCTVGRCHDAEGCHPGRAGGAELF